MENEGDFWQARKNFLAHLHYGKGYSKETCYGYHSDLGSGGGGWRRPPRTRSEPPIPTPSSSPPGRLGSEG